MTLPIIIIATRARTAARCRRRSATRRSASAPRKLQAVLHHVLPLALPGILTGTIIGMAHALGETAPLLMIGMLAFIVDVPTSPLIAGDRAAGADLPLVGQSERAFVEQTAAAIIVLLVFLLAMNGVAIYFARRFERRW